MAWAVNTFALPAVTYLENIGCGFLLSLSSILLTSSGIVSMLGFVGFVIALLALSPKADAAFVFKDAVNETG